MHKVNLKSISNQEGYPRACNQDTNMNMTRTESISTYYVVVDYLHDGGRSIAQETHKPVTKDEASNIANRLEYERCDIVDNASVIHKDDLEAWLDGDRKPQVNS